MRPSYRYALAAAAVTALGVAVAVWSYAPPAHRTVSRPLGAPESMQHAQTEPREPPPELPEVLEQVRTEEAQDLGPLEASRRQRVREQLLRARARTHPRGEAGIPAGEPIGPGAAALPE